MQHTQKHNLTSYTEIEYDLKTYKNYYPVNESLTANGKLIPRK